MKMGWGRLLEFSLSLSVRLFRYLVLCWIHFVDLYKTLSFLLCLLLWPRTPRTRRQSAIPAEGARRRV